MSLSPVAIQFDLMETKGIENRTIDHVILDLALHGFECIQAPFVAAGWKPTLSVTAAAVATYVPLAGETTPPVPTAARIDGTIVAGPHEIPYLIRVGKRLHKNQKRLVFWGRLGVPLHLVNLEGDKWQPHYQVLRRLITAEPPDMILALPDHIAALELCTEALRLESDEGVYPSGVTPSFLLQLAPPYAEAPPSASRGGKPLPRE